MRPEFQLRKEMCSADQVFPTPQLINFKMILCESQSKFR